MVQWSLIRRRLLFKLVSQPRRSLVVLVFVALAAIAAASVSVAGAHGHRQKHHHHRHHHRPHRQAFKGSLDGPHPKVVKVTIEGGKGGGGDPGDDYPAKWRNARQDSLLDQWLEYNRECTSFAAWALYSRNGFVMPFNDNANKWGPDATHHGYAVNSTPAVGSIAWSNAGTYGHVAYVVAVSGGSVTIEEYNEYGNGTYDKRTVAASSFTGYIHFKDTPSEPAPPPAPTPVATPPAPTPPVATLPGTTPAAPGAVPVTPAAAPTFAETTGGVTHTWTNYTNAGGTEGSSIPSNTTVQIACALPGFRVADGNTWWYRIASIPWGGAYYASADAFYNNGQTSGSLIGTPFVDAAVPSC
jgi:surface antigen